MTIMDPAARRALPTRSEGSEAEGLPLPEEVLKRNGELQPFDMNRIRKAVTLCYRSLPFPPKTSVSAIASSVANMVAAKYMTSTPTVEDVQDIVEYALLSAGEFDAAKHYILYREARAQERLVVPADVQRVFDADKAFFPSPSQQFMFYDKYSRYNHVLKRRETWIETVDRNVAYLRHLADGKLDDKVFGLIHDFILEMRAMPSMRSLSQAGEAAIRNSAAIYNCSYLPIEDLRAFPEMMLISMAGCGVGFSVERMFVEELPRIKRQTGETLDTWVVADSSEGWAAALDHGIKTWFDGKDVDFDFSEVRPFGAVLMTKGGRASGPGPLIEALAFCRSKILHRQGSFLHSVDCHDMACVVLGAAVSGGQRRTAAISLFDFDDVEMLECKSGDALERNPWRWNANNSAVWPEEGITQEQLITQMQRMFRSRRGEPGIFSRSNAQRTGPARRVLRSGCGTNPCGEIVLQPYQFCNLSIAVARPEDTLGSLMAKVEVAAIIGTIQSTATTFPGLRDEWKINCEEERLLGVDINGEQDCPLLMGQHGPIIMRALKQHVLDVNEKYAALLGINPAAATTCNKPNGNSSELLNTSNGIMRRHAPFYKRRMRVSGATPLYKVLRDAGVPLSPENGQTEADATTWVVTFPVAAPEGSKVKRGWSAVDQCEWWLVNKLNWCEHNPSVTITYTDEEMIPLMQWVCDHRDVIGGMAFLPLDDADYGQMPYEEITEDEYRSLSATFPPVDYSLIFAHELSDMTEAAQTLACTAGAC
jgi:ribonucleoside-triphosphate reductase